jgi:hypothetical protein
MEATSLRFAHAARVLSRVARERALQPPSFRSPPALAGVQRSLRRRGDSGMVAVRLRDRPWPAVLADMIEGVVVVNRLVGVDADELRSLLWAAVEGEVAHAA